MNYRFCEDQDFSDYACGRVLRGGAGMPNFPARLALELYGRGASHLPADAEIVLWDPCCGSGYLLTVAALRGQPVPRCVLASDIQEGAVSLARENLALISAEGRAARQEALRAHLQEFGRESYALALESLDRIGAQCVGRQVETEVRVHDVLAGGQPFDRRPNLVVTDVPYGCLVSWQGERAELGQYLLQALAPALDAGAVAVVCMDKKQRVCSDGYVRLEKEQIGKRRFEIYQKT